MRVGENQFSLNRAVDDNKKNIPVGFNLLEGSHTWGTPQIMRMPGFFARHWQGFSKDLHYFGKEPRFWFFLVVLVEPTRYLVKMSENKQQRNENNRIIFLGFRICVK